MTTELLITLLAGAITQLITKASEKYNVSQTRCAIIVSIILGALIYVGKILTIKYPVQWEQCLGFIMGTYGISQIVYNMLTKYKVKK